MPPIPHSDQELSPHLEYYQDIPREKRVLNRGAFVLLQLNTSTHSTKFDSDAVKHFRVHPPTPAPTRRKLILSALTRSHGRGGNDAHDGARTMFHLPPEITYQVLSYLKALDEQRLPSDPMHRTYCSLCYLKNLHSIALASRSWNGPATELLYTTLKLSLDDVCEYHNRGIAWGDGKYWWARRTTYLSQRYLKPLLRTLTARPQLACMFRVLEIDMHHRISLDYQHLPLWTKLISLCSGLARVVGDPCIFFAPLDPYLESLKQDALNFMSRGTLYRGRQTRVLTQQRKLWKVLAAHGAWVEWSWVSSCMDIRVPAFRRFHMGWQALRRLEICQFYYPRAMAEESGEAEKEGGRAIACLGVLESLSLKSSTLRVLRCVPKGRLTELGVEIDIGDRAGPLRQELTELWVWLKADAEGGSKLRSFSISSEGHYAHIMEKWLPRTLALMPDLHSLSISLRYRPDPGIIMLNKDDASMADLAPWQAAFPPGTKLQRLVFFCPGWSHNKMLLKIMRRGEVWPALREMEYCPSTVVTEINVAEFLGTPITVSKAKTRQEGTVVDSELKMECHRRGMAGVNDWAASGGGGGGGGGGEDGVARVGTGTGAGAGTGVEVGRVRMRKVGWQ
ncbi:uncharacterized protein H6S33_010190 [Morchella sextelata]|uniref:uncharacterized protein n=1 Tax=Morchella sextelata TaxID=1174677 RepID=UPI001D04DEAA|nr:uncharacterized protein H6S33_010190 [Morchella sextelata]KAH0612138.1 hypothetical protein H6S33_010190 [Morchella sextelata]